MTLKLIACVRVCVCALIFCSLQSSTIWPVTHTYIGVLYTFKHTQHTHAHAQATHSIPRYSHACVCEKDSTSKGYVRKKKAISRCKWVDLCVVCFCTLCDSTEAMAFSCHSKSSNAHSTELFGDSRYTLMRWCCRRSMSLCHIICTVRYIRCGSAHLPTLWAVSEVEKWKGKQSTTSYTFFDNISADPRQASQAQQKLHMKNRLNPQSDHMISSIAFVLYHTSSLLAADTVCRSSVQRA